MKALAKDIALFPVFLLLMALIAPLLAVELAFRWALSMPPFKPGTRVMTETALAKIQVLGGFRGAACVDGGVPADSALPNTNLR